MKRGAKIIVESHEQFESVFILRGKEYTLCTKSINQGKSVYNEKRVSVVERRERKLNVEFGIHLD